jgi:transcriptional regulator with XRE-family HTH domain
MSEELKDKIELLRKNKSWTQGQLALYAEIDRSYVTKLEAGDAPNVSGVILARIARALETTTDFLLGLSNDPNPRPVPNHPSLLDPHFRELMVAWQSLAALDDPEPCDVIHDLAIYLAAKHAAKED